MKTIVWTAIRVLTKLLWILPLKNNRVLFFSFSGKQYSCNPKYISEYLNDYCKGEYDIVWAFDDPGKYGYLSEQGIKVIPFNSFSFLKVFFTAKVIVTNDSFYPFLEKRPSQKLIQTWHGGGAYKRVGSSTNLYSRGTLKRFTSTMKNVNLYVSSCKKFTDLLIREAFSYTGEILEVGMPRNDLLIQNDAPKGEIKKYYNIPEETMILLYAPTFRQDLKVDLYNLDYSQVIECIKEKYNRECVILCRFHHKMSMRSTEYFSQVNIINASDYPDMQEILFDTDILITDYSSSMWDFSLTYKPCFIYAVDAENYIENRNFYTPMNEWPFPIAIDTVELIRNIKDFDENKYNLNVKKHHKDLGNFESGRATENVVRYIEDIIYKTNAKNREENYL